MGVGGWGVRTRDNRVGLEEEVLETLSQLSGDLGHNFLQMGREVFCDTMLTQN